MKKKITQAGFADSVGISREYFNALLSGSKDASKPLAERIAGKIGCKPVTWTYGTDDQRQVAFNRYQEKAK